MWFYERVFLKILRQGKIPNHMAFIMDGNRRFAKKKGIVTAKGH